VHAAVNCFLFFVCYAVWIVVLLRVIVRFFIWSYVDIVTCLWLPRHELVFFLVLRRLFVSNIKKHDFGGALFCVRHVYFSRGGLFLAIVPKSLVTVRHLKYIFTARHVITQYLL